MISLELGFAIIPGLILFLYGIEHFSREIQRMAGEQFRTLLAKLTANPLKGAFLGAIATSIVQSSTATTVIAVGLVDAGIISFANSIGVIIGANVGTTLTAQLVALKLTYFAPFFILLGFLTSLFGGRYRFLGKPLFYFGLVFFSLDLISQAIEPFKTDPALTGLFSQFSNIFVAIGAGFLFTIIVQSSSVTTGLVVLLVGGGLLTLGQGIPLIMGANIGTTVTSFIASIKLDIYAKRAAFAHFLFNFGGVLIFLPFIFAFADVVESLGGTAAQQMANAHLAFNVIVAAIFLIAIRPFTAAVTRAIPGEDQEVVFRPKYLNGKLPESNEEACRSIGDEIAYSLEVTKQMYSYSIKILEGEATLHKVEKLESLNDFLDDRISETILELSKRQISKKIATKTVLLVRMSNAIEQLGDMAKQLAVIANDGAESRFVLSKKSKSALELSYSKFEENLSLIANNAPALSDKDRKIIRRNDRILRAIITSSYKDHLKRLYSQKAYAGSEFVELVSVIESSNAKLREIRKLSEEYSRIQ